MLPYGMGRRESCLPLGVLNSVPLGFMLPKNEKESTGL